MLVRIGDYDAVSGRRNCAITQAQRLLDGGNAFKRAGIFQANRHLVGDGLHQHRILVGQAVDDVVLHVQYAQHLIAQHNRHRNFGFGVGQQGIGQPAISKADIGHQHGVSGGGGATDQATTARNAVIVGQHYAPSTACATRHRERVFGLVEQVNMRVVVIECAAQLLDHFQRQGCRIKNGGKAAADLTAGFQCDCTLLQTSQRGA